MAWRSVLIGAALAAGVAAPALAHPHVFIDAGVEFRFDDQGRLAALRIVWVYDDLTSLMILTDRGFDPDGDGQLTEDETARLSGFDMAWEPGFAGDSYLLAGDTPLALGGPQGWTAQVQAGRIITTHLRPLAEPLAPGALPLVVQIYDPGYYTAYTIAADPVISGRQDCAADVYGPDPVAADAALQAALKELSGLDLEQGFPAVGEHYADEVRLTCPQG
jgi:polyphosphate kinase